MSAGLGSVPEDRVSERILAGQAASELQGLTRSQRGPESASSRD